ncbi:DUF2099 family protein [Methanoculleus sp. FWC-SCC1]|uniref:DUF2099 family protein n=1 Tax=Methanoculleus frigidifontis TaxID=2584085 RepID=A0ABT8M783_9EURY|nr:methanogenesis marker 8 protein [Methanoculleus sp. FWC-SCC1]MDN7023781.1 DUF2099 family protein [Methanoculleus sp. FWC-SCC1]
MPDTDEHIIEAIGKTRVVVRNGNVVEVGESVIADCPLAKRFACPVTEISADAVRENIEHRIRAFGMCTPDRAVLETREFVGFGASELLSFGMKTGLIDAAVIACDGAGTVVVTDPAMVQGIGGRMSGLVRTTPYPSVIDRIEKGGGIVLDREGAAIDQGAGVALAAARGYRNVAVTVARPQDTAAIRRAHPATFIVAVHSTGMTRDEAAVVAAAADLVTACASGAVREVAGPRALVQAGISVPVYAMTERGKDLIIEKIRRSDEQVLLKPTRLPVPGDRQPEPLV